MNTKFSSILVAALTLSIGASFVAPTYAASPSAGVKQYKLAEAPEHNQLNLTSEQKAQIKQIREQAQQQIQAILNDSQKTQLQNALSSGQKQHQAWASLNLTSDQKAKVRQINQAAEQQVYNNVYTPEQQQQVQKIRQEMRARWQQKKQQQQQ